MLANLFRSIFGTKNAREMKRIGRHVEAINACEPAMQALSDEQLRAKTAEFRARLAGGATLDSLIPEAFAAVREASRRTLGLRHHDVQLIGGVVLHEGRIAEMRTGEGKTLVATLPAYLNALTGKGVHVVTVNDYLAQRDANWMRPVYEFLGLGVGVVLSQQSQEDKRAAYAADITYGTNNEYGFDYLRDNMALSMDERVQRDLAFAIVDEVDSILIDEARTPLIISGPSTDSSVMYRKVNELIPMLRKQEDKDAEVKGDFLIDEKGRQIELTEDGHRLVEDMLVRNGMLKEGDSLYAAHNLHLLHHVHVALKAHHLFLKDVEYIVQDNQVIIVDEHTGRTMPGRRWSDGIHQAVEAKEGVTVRNENQTLASTTFQNYFRLYGKLSGMTGTADTEAPEFRQIYGLDVVVIPTNRPMIREDLNDLVYLSVQEKYEAIVGVIREVNAKGAPILVGTASIETSELLSAYLRKEKIQHAVLNAKYHAQEAEIIAQAGRPGAVTIATNMAGRGTDIVLGGSWQAEAAKIADPTPAQVEKLKAEWQARHDQVLAAGGLHIIGSERHESRRIDNQLRGRSGRQGDPGMTRFYLSLEDTLMRRFAGDTVRNMMQRLGMQRGEAIEHRWVTRAIENAQRKVESHNFDIRKQLLEYDDIANDQRRVVYLQRRELLEADDVRDSIVAMREDVLSEIVAQYIPPESVADMWDVPGLERALEVELHLKAPVQQWLDAEDHLEETGLKKRLLDKLVEIYNAKEAQVGPEAMRQIEKQLMLQVLDKAWKEHLGAMDYLRQGIHLRGYAQKNPKQEYKREAFELFEQMLDQVKHELIRILSTIQLQRKEEAEELERLRREEAERQKMNFLHTDPDSIPRTAEEEKPQPREREFAKVGRNDPCPCGSGKKFKQCHGKID
ncbi:MAG: preprotein translocase subunit SecA [Gammaproteobacteria bacterium]